MTPEMTAIVSTRPANARPVSEPIVGGLLQRIQAEYREMPGLALTVRQGARLWDVTARESESSLIELADRGFLVRDRRGAYHLRNCPRCC